MPTPVIFVTPIPTWTMVFQSVGSSEVAWAGKTAEEIRSIAQSEESILLVPVGSIEQHGRHLPVSTDTLLADAVSKAGAEDVHQDISILVAPPIYPGYSPHHMDFGGTLTSEFNNFLAFLTDFVNSGLQNGFDAVLLVNGHGGNIPAIGAATSMIGVENPDGLVLGTTYSQLAEPFIDVLRDSDLGGMGHAGEFETSLMLHLRPDLVKEDKVEGTPLKDPNSYTLNDMFDGGVVSAYRPFTAYSETGAIGNPELASTEKGEAIFEGLRSELSALLREIVEELKTRKNTET